MRLLRKWPSWLERDSGKAADAAQRELGGLPHCHSFKTCAPDDQPLCGQVARDRSLDDFLPKVWELRDVHRHYFQAAGNTRPIQEDNANLLVVGLITVRQIIAIVLL